MSLPEWPPRVKEGLDSAGLEELYRWWQVFSSYFTSRLDTAGDVTMSTPGKGIVLKNAAGTITKRVRLNDGGTGIVIEDV
jgi:hypothetical protein